MQRTSEDGTVRRIGSLYATGSVGSLSDGRLLERFASLDGVDREDAFAAIVQRHGPMVLATCRRMLGASADVDDAFQAVFLVLARKAGAIRGVEDIGGWLRVVAVRTGREVRVRSARIRAREGIALDVGRAADAPDPDLFELKSILDEELDRLPARFREAIRLCELDGLPRRDAAERLGLAEGTLSSRLARGRSLLRDRLARRGLAVGLLGAVLASPSKASPLPDSALRLALNATRNGAVPGTVSEAVASLAEGVLAMLAPSRWKWLAMAACAAGALALGSGLGWGHAARPNEPASFLAESSKPEASDEETVRGVVVDEAGRPVAGAEVLLNAYGSDERRGLTGPDGSFAMRPVDSLGVLVLSPDGRRVGKHVYARSPLHAPQVDPARIVVSPGGTLDVRVETVGGPVGGAMVEAVSDRCVVAHAETDSAGRARLLLPTDARVQWVVARKGGEGFDYVEFGDLLNVATPQGVPAAELQESVTLELREPWTVKIRLLGEAGPLADVPLFVPSLRSDSRRSLINFRSRLMEATTGPDGVAVFDWLPTSPSRTVFYPADGSLSRRSIEIDPEGETSVERFVHRMVPVRGRVALPDGSPARGLTVRAVGSGWDHNHGSGWARTAADGVYAMNVPPGESYCIWVEHETWAAPSLEGVELKAGALVNGIDFKLARGTVIRGRVTLGPERGPASGVAVSASEDIGSLPPPVGIGEVRIRPGSPIVGARTDADGRYALNVGPGNYRLTFDSRPPGEILQISGQAEEVRDHHLDRPKRRLLVGRVADEAGGTVAGAVVEIGPEPTRFVTTGRDGRFCVEVDRFEQALYVTNRDGSMATSIVVAPETSEVTIVVRPTARVVGVVVDGARNPRPAMKMLWLRRTQVGRWGRLDRVVGGLTSTDHAGRFSSPPLLVGEDYEIRPWPASSAPPDFRVGCNPIHPWGAGRLDLGEIRIPVALRH
ncbi:sigma-70 family RNA polymerase sigma factor [Paludisphaera mucosa]|uniref:Sigma-70 family RNA polymerase sigma factor n=1 Tax=Paludisphaera mucosa TaxID=3030827 RepID=A0ABT6FHH8_9BACT|nr:sigma-70 family RNA polymerase sigma factor [Paludisphaera mucosa]MDG3006992.1 sigma-70 family RNA polymerase sigma factor [Paludisphaera mucosa]